MEDRIVQRKKTTVLEASPTEPTNRPRHRQLMSNSPSWRSQPLPPLQGRKNRQLHPSLLCQPSNRLLKKLLHRRHRNRHRRCRRHDHVFSYFRRQWWPKQSSYRTRWPTEVAGIKLFPREHLQKYALKKVLRHVRQLRYTTIVQARRKQRPGETISVDLAAYFINFVQTDIWHLFKGPTSKQYGETWWEYLDNYTTPHPQMPLTTAGSKKTALRQAEKIYTVAPKEMCQQKQSRSSSRKM